MKDEKSPWLRLRTLWAPRPETAGEAAERLQRWLRSVAEIEEFAGLVIHPPKRQKPEDTKPGRLMEVDEIFPLLVGVGSERPAKHRDERDSIAFMCRLYDPWIKGGERFSGPFTFGHKEGGGGTFAFPDLVPAKVTHSWRDRVMESLITHFDADEVRFEADHTTFTPDGRAVGNPRYWLRWDRGRRPLDPPLDEPTPPARSRPWLGGTPYEWPEHAALFGATPD
jgi:hypothetical protein